MTALKQYFVCGTRDISNEPYAGASGAHDTFGNAVNTTNRAAPHNLQIFMLSADGTVLNCLPGYWNPQDLYEEMALAYKLNQVWQDQSLSRSQKNQMFTQMHLNNISQHSAGMQRRSHMQGFDEKYEAEHNPNSDFFGYQNGQRMVKTVDVVMHERMAQRPFIAYESFDVARFSDYGKPMYDKHEDYRDATGHVDQMAAREAPKIGNIEVAEPRRRNVYNEEQFVDRRHWGNGQPSNGVRLWGQQNSQSSGVHLWGQNQTSAAHLWGQG
jgi:hypothetical protein